MKNIVIAGRLTKDASVRKSQSGDSVCGFSVAVDDRRGKDKQTMFFDCALWGRRAEALARYLTKGTAVSVSGDLGTREYDGRTYLTVRVDQITLQGGGQRDSEPRDAGGYGGQQGGGRPVSDFDSIPF